MKHLHIWVKYVLKYGRFDAGPRGEVFYTGYRCRCGETGYAIP